MRNPNGMGQNVLNTKSLCPQYDEFNAKLKMFFVRTSMKYKRNKTFWDMLI